MLERMSQLHASGAVDIKSDVISYSSVINCWAKSGRKDAPDAALELLRTMQQQYLAGEKSLRPDAIVHNQVISAFERAGQANRAKEIRKEMRSWEANNTNVLAKPETSKGRGAQTDNNYASIVTAAKNGKPELAESLFLRMLQEYTKNKKGEKPSPKLHTIALHAETM